MEVRNLSARSLSDSRWGRSISLEGVSPGSRIPMMMGMSDDDSAQAHDWTVYVQRVPSIPDWNNDADHALHTLVVRWGTGGAAHQERLPLGIGAEYVLHYVSGQAPEVYVEISSALDTPPVGDRLTVTCAPGRPSEVSVPFFRNLPNLITEAGIVTGYWDTIPVPFGTTHMYWRASLRSLVPIGPWMSGPSAVGPAKQWPIVDALAAYASAQGQIMQLGFPATATPENNTAVIDELRAGQQGAAMARSWCSGGHAVIAGEVSGGTTSAAQITIVGWFRCLR